MRYKDMYSTEPSLSAQEVYLTDGVPNEAAFYAYASKTPGTVTFLLCDTSLDAQRNGPKHAAAMLRYLAAQLPKEFPAFRIAEDFFAVFSEEDTVRKAFGNSVTVRPLTYPVSEKVTDWHSRLREAEDHLRARLALVMTLPERTIPEIFRESPGTLPVALFWKIEIDVTITKPVTAAAHLTVFPTRFTEAADRPEPLLPFVVVVTHPGGRQVALYATDTAHFGIQGARFFLECAFPWQKGFGITALINAEEPETVFTADIKPFPGRFLPESGGLHVGGASVFPISVSPNGLHAAAVLKNETVTLAPDGKVHTGSGTYAITKDSLGYRAIPIKEA